MSKLSLYLTSIILGLFVYLFWLSGSHGHVVFRYWMKGDWVLLSLLILFLGLPTLILLIKLFKKILRRFVPTRI